MPRFLIMLMLCLSCHAHESPSHTLELVNKHIEENSTPELLFQRAMAYKSLGKMELATADLTAAIKAQPNQLSWQLERCRIQLTTNRADIALHSANKALKLTKDNSQRAEIHILRAQAYQLSNRPKPSLQACQLAFKEVPDGKIEWFLLRAENQYLLGLHQQRLRGLTAGLKKFPASIIRPHWVDALIDAGKVQTALTHIEKELLTLRWKAHWQIKQARAFIAINRKGDAEKILSAALHEINNRLSPTQPDILLLADKAQIAVLLDDTKSARETIRKLQRHRAPHWITARLLKSTSKRQTTKTK